MDDLYYLNRQQYKAGDVKIAFRYAWSLCKQDPNIDTITLLVPQANQYDILTSELSISTKYCTKHIIPNDLNKCVQVHTLKTYEPSFQVAGHKGCELLISILVDSKELEKFVDKSKVKYWIIVPWLMDDILKEYLSIFEAKDIETGTCISAPDEPDERIINAIGWLRETSYPNEGYHHPLDENRLHQMANAIKHYKVPFDYAATVYAGLHHGLIPSAARNTAEAFRRAQSRAFAIKYNSYGLDFLKDMMETSHDKM